MSLRWRIVVLGISGLLSSALGETGWQAGIREGGGGFYLSAPEQNFHLNFLGYGQFLGQIASQEYSRGGLPDFRVGMNIRRARLSALATLHRNFELLFDFGRLARDSSREIHRPLFRGKLKIPA